MFPGPPKARDDDGPSDPCLGPNPPAYCFTGIRSVEPEEEDPSSVFARFGITPRIAGSQFAADGGRIGYDDGGMLVKPGFGGTRQGYRTAQTQESKQKSAQEFKERTSKQDDPSPQQTTAKKPFGDDSDAMRFDKRQLASFGIFGDPKKRQQLAELINYQKLPQAGEKFNPSFDIGFFGDKLKQRFEDEKKRRKDLNLPTETKGAFVDMIESGALGAGTSTLFDENVGKLFEGVPLDASFFSTEVGDVNPTFITREGGGIKQDVKKNTFGS